MYADNSRHDGCYREGKKSGAGTLRYATGAIFEGEFYDDLRHGTGRLELPNGEYFDGQWEKDLPHGHGVYVDGRFGGERFEGSWNRGVRSGAGKLVQGWAKKGKEQGEVGGDGENEEGVPEQTAWFSGSFEGGLPHGDGMMGYGPATYCGRVEQGVWTGGGGRVDLGENRGTFEGMWFDGLPRGGGRWLCAESGFEEDCTFKEGYYKQIWPN